MGCAENESMDCFEDGLIHGSQDMMKLSSDTVAVFEATTSRRREARETGHCYDQVQM